jgi:hypothetical protein
LERLFDLGALYITTHASKTLEPDDVLKCLERHAMCDWGELGEEDREENELSLRRGFRLLSSYTGRNGVNFWIITEADRLSTTVLLPDDY